ncbi:MAG TPA: thioredoxin domain-containing protein [Candidatus Paceibacterota bacterium]
MEEKNSPKSYATPIAVVIAGLLIAGAIVYGNVADKNPEQLTLNEIIEENLNPIDKDDHIRGVDKAKFTVIEYSDLECPYCKIFHQIMNDLLKTNGTEIKWVFRHLPLETLHTKALTEAIASECVAKIGGEENFWKYIDTIFEATPSNDGLDLATLPTMAGTLGLDEAQFSKCLEDKETIKRVDKDLENATAIGANGTPYVIVIGPDKKPIHAFNAESLQEASSETKAFATELYTLYGQAIEKASQQ